MANRARAPLTRRHWIGTTAIAGAATLTRPIKTMADDSSLPTQVLYYGQDTLPTELIKLRAGPVTALLDPKLAYLRYIRYAGKLALLGIYSAVRDRNWGTVTPQVSQLKVEQTADSFDVQFEVNCIEDPIDFHWLGKIVGNAQGEFTYRMFGKARSSFLRNRIGFCVLHPAELAGRLCGIIDWDDQTTPGTFPDLIAPHQPFFNVKGITHEVEPGLTAEVRMEGDTFETEDQRNWTDASYKTYCTPLARPFPVTVRTGATVQQMVRVRFRGKPAARPASGSAASISIRPAGAPRPLPAIGFGLARESPPLTSMEIARLHSAYPAHLRADLQLSAPSWPDLFSRAVAESGALDAPLEAALFLSGDGEAQLRSLAAHVSALKPKIKHWLIFHQDEPSTTARWLDLARHYLEGPIGGGANSNFTELNRGRPGAPGDIVCYSVNPQVHAFDNLSLVETFAGLRETVRTARSFSGQARLAVTPVTLKPRFNPGATAAVAPDPHALPKSVDPRQMSLFGAGWTLGALAALAESGVDSITCFETTGWRGLMETERGSLMPARFRSTPGAVFPLYHVLADIGEISGEAVIPLAISDPLAVSAMLLDRNGRRRLLVANLTDAVQYLRVTGAQLAPNLRIWRLDEYSASRALKLPEPFRRDPGRSVHSSGSAVEIALLPYAYAKLDPV